MLQKPKGVHGDVRMPRGRGRGASQGPSCDVQWPLTGMGPGHYVARRHGGPSPAWPRDGGLGAVGGRPRRCLG